MMRTVTSAVLPPACSAYGEQAAAHAAAERMHSARMAFMI